MFQVIILTALVLTRVVSAATKNDDTSGEDDEIALEDYVDDELPNFSGDVSSAIFGDTNGYDVHIEVKIANKSSKQKGKKHDSSHEQHAITTADSASRSKAKKILDLIIEKLKNKGDESELHKDGTETAKEYNSADNYRNAGASLVKDQDMAATARLNDDSAPDKSQEEKHVKCNAPADESDNEIRVQIPSHLNKTAMIGKILRMIDAESKKVLLETTSKYEWNSLNNPKLTLDSENALHDKKPGTRLLLLKKIHKNSDSISSNDHVSDSDDKQPDTTSSKGKNKHYNPSDRRKIDQNSKDKSEVTDLISQEISEEKNRRQEALDYGKSSDVKANPSSNEYPHTEKVSDNSFAQNLEDLTMEQREIDSHKSASHESAHNSLVETDPIHNLVVEPDPVSNTLPSETDPAQNLPIEVKLAYMHIKKNLKKEAPNSADHKLKRKPPHYDSAIQNTQSNPTKEREQVSDDSFKTEPHTIHSLFNDSVFQEAGSRINDDKSDRQHDLRSHSTSNSQDQSVDTEVDRSLISKSLMGKREEKLNGRENEPLYSATSQMTRRDKASDPLPSVIVREVIRPEEIGTVNKDINSVDAKENYQNAVNEVEGKTARVEDSAVAPDTKVSVDSEDDEEDDGTGDAESGSDDVNSAANIVIKKASDDISKMISQLTDRSQVSRVLENLRFFVNNKRHQEKDQMNSVDKRNKVDRNDAKRHISRSRTTDKPKKSRLSHKEINRGQSEKPKLLELKKRTVVPEKRKVGDRVRRRVLVNNELHPNVGESGSAIKLYSEIGPGNIRVPPVFGTEYDKNWSPEEVVNVEKVLKSNNVEVVNPDLNIDSMYSNNDYHHVGFPPSTHMEGVGMPRNNQIR